jgi:3-hydroxyacyl-CoA dehydrogenase/enoyl-CoA hydratase/3-hydroxybutyryl-CoA epimerase
MSMIDLQIDADGIATVTLNMPGRAMNVIDWQLGKALDETITRLASDDAVKGVVLTSGKSSFVAGADLGIMKDFVREGVSLLDAAKLIATLGNTMRRLETLGKPVVGASTGTALGGGLELLLACHYRVAADVSGAQYGLPEVKLGLLPGGGGTQRLPRLIGIAQALPLMVEGRLVSTQDALKLGIVNEVVPADQLLAAAKQALRDGKVNPVAPWDRKGFRLPGGDHSQLAVADVFTAVNARIFSTTHGLLPAPKAIAVCVYEGARLPIDRALRIEQQQFALLVQGSVAQGLIRVQFFAKQAADKLSRRPKDVPAAKVTRLGVLGTGFMGQGIAQVAAQVGMAVVLVDRDEATAQRAVAAIAATLAQDVARGRLSAERAAQVQALLNAGASLQALAGCELVIEAVPEDRALKMQLMRQANEVLGADTLWASNTSTLPIDGLADASSRPAEVVGLHFFSPVPRMALVEVITGPRTSPAALARALDFVRQIKRTPIVVNDAHAFYTTRCVVAFVREGLRLLAEGVGAAEIDNAGVSAGMAVGPLTLADEVGLDVLHHVQDEERAAGLLADEADAAVVLNEALHRAGRQGRKGGAGLYDYSSGRKQLWAGLPDLLQSAGLARDTPAQLSQAEIGERLMAVQWLTAADAFGQGIITDAGEADVGAVLGWAFPSHLGGPLWAIDAEGAAAFSARMDRLAERHGARFAVPEVVRAMAGNGQRFHPR